MDESMFCKDSKPMCLLAELAAACIATAAKVFCSHNRGWRMTFTHISYKLHKIIKIGECSLLPFREHQHTVDGDFKSIFISWANPSCDNPGTIWGSKHVKHFVEPRAMTSAASIFYLYNCHHFLWFNYLPWNEELSTGSNLTAFYLALAFYHKQATINNIALAWKMETMLNLIWLIVWYQRWCKVWTKPLWVQQHQNTEDEE